MQNPYANYRVGLVMSNNGMSPNQLSVFRSRLKEIARLGGASPDGLVVSVPVVHRRVNETTLRRTEECLAPLHGIEYLRVEILEEGDLDAALEHLRGLDEVWCAPGPHQRERQSRPAKILAAAQALREAPRFKLLHYWTQTEVERPDNVPKTKP